MSRHRFRFAFEATPAAVHAARHRISAAVRRRDAPLDDEVCSQLELVATELLTNAVRHASGPLTVDIELEGGLVVIEVVDGSTEAPLPRVADADDAGGRGLALIDALCLLHGSERVASGKRCWAVLPVEQQAAQQAPHIDVAPAVNAGVGGAANDSARWSLTAAGARLLLRMPATGT
ncbi:ATP-binding protein [Streptomyces olivochromogenes]|uniref:ATP-binding protein n=1 Tax=Streptomyces olivochromogenes TaxID=1963 RepID=UPI001F3482BB|nr:ATP-binding protein [Streptomyces olivochromogenes]MCF3131878.1 ATP-binding protein [Streptomyces olivochromogenes]